MKAENDTEGDAPEEQTFIKIIYTPGNMLTINRDVSMKMDTSHVLEKLTFIVSLPSVVRSFGLE